MRPILLALLAYVATIASAGQYAPANPKWNRPVPPFRIAGNLYYVGAANISSYLIATSGGLIVIDGGYRETAPLIEASIGRLGFRVEDVRVLLNTHEHSDHAGGFAALQAATHARLLVNPAAAPLLESGGKNDFAFHDELLFPPVRPDGLLADGMPVTLGGVSLTPHFTPGHTRGCTTWTLTVRQQGRPLHVVLACSVSAPGYQLVDNRDYPEIVEDYRASFRTLRALPCDIWLTPHGEEFDLEEKRKRLAEHPDGAANPFIDPAGYREYLKEREAELNARVAQQTTTGGVRH